MNDKSFKTFEEQYEILKNKGITFNSLVDINTLTYVEYFRLSPYFKNFFITEEKNSIEFYKIYKLYEFDHKLRSILLYLIESIEVSFKTKIAYYHSKKYGPLGYKEKTNFTNENYFIQFQETYKKNINLFSKHEKFVQHYIENYDTNFPFWVLIELLSFGTMSRLFSNLPLDVKKEICKSHFDKINDNYISNWLQALTILRNTCAHGGRLLNKYISYSIKFDKKDIKIFIENNMNVNEISKQIFGYIYICKKIVPNISIWSNFLQQFKILIYNSKEICLKCYGFPKNWEELLK